MDDPQAVNRVFWRSCSFLLGAVMQKTFKEDSGLFLHSFPRPNVRSGSFTHDIALNEGNWRPSIDDLRTLASNMLKLGAAAKKFERLDVSHEIALEMFRDNPFKREQLPSISNSNEGIVTLYRVDDHIDISKGPMMSSSRFLSRCNIAAAHKISSSSDPCNIYRVQGVALPTGFSMSSFAFGILADRAKKLVSDKMISLSLMRLFITEESYFRRAQQQKLTMRKPMRLTLIMRRSFNKVLIRKQNVTFLFAMRN
jgi:large subunit ribosomal protein L39